MAKRLEHNILSRLCLGLSLLMAVPAASAVDDLLETPARETRLAPERLLNDLARAGQRILAAGERGHIIFSSDEGQSWTQAQVPVSVTLTGIDFGSEEHGWAVGHSGVVLHSSDSGEHWTLQITGIDAAKLAIAATEQQIETLEQRIDEAPEDEKEDLEWKLDDLLFALENLRADLDIGPVNPMLDVWFRDEAYGFVVGAYGMFLHTGDGGETWEDWSPKLENPTGFHLNSISPVAGGALVIAGEAGQLFLSSDQGRSWEKLDIPYSGSLFGAIGTGQPDEILAFGLRGNVLLSTDLGETWDVLEGTGESTLNEGAVSEDGQITLVGNGGAVLRSNDGGRSFQAYYRDDRDGLMAVEPLPGDRLLLVGENGAQVTDTRGENPQ